MKKLEEDIRSLPNDDYKMFIIACLLNIKHSGYNQIL